MDKIIVITAAVLLIGFIVWWFFGKRQIEATAATIAHGQQTVEIKVDGGYVPNTVTLKQGVPAKLVFNRKDPSTCLDEVVFPDFGIHEALPVNARHEIPLDTSKPGEYKYACGMNMFFGKVVVK
ncbi:MAG TPA: cupredoxin domain-containing protein [Candidatus Saccharimonadales bacterium]|nr:cupredoxin domain-containing protein [Candidatus Saccharimonadales bacterium]